MVFSDKALTEKENKKHAELVDNIDTLVDDVFTKNKGYFSDAKVENKRPSDEFLKRGVNKNQIKIIKNKLPIRKILAVVLSLILILVLIPASLPFLYGGSDSDVSISLYPENVHDGDSMFVNATIPSFYNIRSVTADIGGIETLGLSLIDNSTDQQLWQVVWLAHDVEVGEHIVKISALDQDNKSYTAEVRWSVLAKETIDFNKTSEPSSNETRNATNNETEVLEPLNISISADKESYFVNDAVNIQGAVKYNETLIATAINITIKYSNETISSKLDATNGSFYYKFIPIVDGYYTVNSSAIYVNDTAYSELNILVLEKSDISTNETEISSEEGPKEDNESEVVPEFIFEESEKPDFGKISKVKMDYDKAWKYLFKKANWNLQAFVGGSWQSVDGLKIKYKKTADDFRKFSLDFTGSVNPMANYRLVLNIDLPVVDYSFDEDNYKFYLKYESSGHLWTFMYDYSDIVGLSDLVFNHGMNDGRFWFSVQRNNVPFGANFSLDPSYGIIANAVVDSWEWDSEEGQNENRNGACRINNTDYYLLVCKGESGSDADGWARVIYVWGNNGTIKPSVVSSYEYDTSDGAYANVRHIPGTDKYVIAYQDVTSAKATIVTLQVWATNGTIKQAVIDSQQLTQDGNFPFLLGVTNNVYVVAYCEPNNLKGYMETLWVDASGMINDTTLDTQMFDTVWGFYPYLCLVDSNTVAMTYNSGGGTADFTLVTYNISSAGAITNTPASSWAYETEPYYRSCINKIGPNTFAVTWIVSDYDIQSNTVTIADTGAITKSWIDTLEVVADTAANCPETFVVHDPQTSADGSGILGVTYQGAGSDGWMFTWNVTKQGVMSDTRIGAGYEFDTADSMLYAHVEYVNQSWYLIVYTGTGSDGWSCTVSIATNWASPTFSNPSPTNESIGVPTTPTCAITINDTNNDTMNLYWYENSTGSWMLRQTNSSCSNGTYRWTFSQASMYGQTYYWKVYCNDGVHNVSTWYNFTTETDSTPPTSSVNSISPYWKTSSPTTITSTTSDTGTGVKNVTLYYRYSGNNASWGGNVSAGVDSASPWSWSFAFSNGSGYYQFYSIAIDNATNTGSAPDSADAICGYDNQNPKSSVIDGNISDAVLSTFEWQTIYGKYPNVIRVNNSEYYLIVASAGDYDGYVYTIRVWDDNGTIQQSVVSSYCFDSTGTSIFPSKNCYLSHISETDKYAIAYKCPGNGQKIITIQVWDTNGTIKNSIIDTLSPGAVVVHFSPMINVNENIYAYIYTDSPSGNPTLITFYIDSNGQIGNSFNDIQQLSTYYSYNPNLEMVDSDTVAIVYYEYNGDLDVYNGYLKTYNLSSTGDITNTAADSWTFQASGGNYPFVKHISGNIFAIAYQDGSGDGQIKTLTIADTGMITKSWIGTLEFDTDSCTYPYIYPIYDAKLYAVAYQGTDGDGFVKTMNISADGTIDTVIDTLEFDTSDCIYRPYIAYVNKSNYLIVYEGTGNDGWSCTVSINLNGIPYLKASSPIIISGDGSDTGPSGLKNVTLYYNYSADNVSWGGWTSYGADTTPWSDIIWSFNFPDGLGYYRFYSIAADNASNTESAPGSPDFICAYLDTQAPSSSVSDITPYWHNSGDNPLAITCTDATDTGGSGLKNVTLYYYNSTDNVTWSGPWNFGVDSDPWVACSWSFNFPNSTGWYRFYSRAADNISNIEDPPITNDTECGYDTQKPSSIVNAISPYTVLSSPLAVTATASDSLSGIKNVTIWYTYSTENYTWWNTSWMYRNKLTINHTKVAGSLSNLPILVKFTSDASLANYAQNNGNDIVFTTSTGTKLNHEIEQFNKTTGALSVWVNVTSLNSATDTIIWMYYGNSDCSSQQNSHGTWDSNFKAVYHLSETSGGAGAIKDSTSNHINGTNSGGVTFSQTGQISNALKFDGTGKVDLGNPASFDSASITAECWMKTSTNYVGDGRLVTVGSGATNKWMMTVNANAPANHVAISNSDASHATSMTDSVINNGAWHYLAGTTNTEKIYLNKTLQSSTITDSWSFEASSAMASRGTSWYFTGYLDEVRISSVTRNASWISTTYNSMSSPNTFFTKEGEESWTEWNDPSNPDTGTPWSWNFNFPDGEGYYEFYSIAYDNATNNELAPGNADAKCRYYRNTSFVVSPDLWNMGSAWIEGINVTTGYYFNLTNNGNVAINLTIKASNATNSTAGFSWNLTGTPSRNNFSLLYNKSGVGVWKNINLTYDAFIENLAQGDYQTFDFKILMATVSSKQNLSMHLQVTFKSVIA